ncbi:beta-CASP ribonuclease aCPSF1 [Caldivirga maquilingensis]|uniref:Transcription termination factor FttA n=1 Tax=Caldivirga maquilingensis (strain ATCC 700844 / DSM 13496 / JCM 10307 / IC-167) TaxID=397948 RepID=A8MBV7_CALMQ|nr:beta-CASP ribonuclease aCPSF1 [Caldivirga maquilingensis]ABW01300.1 beta-lactamase domain protein [Caldivirga maquilingensis IC-167]
MALRPDIEEKIIKMLPEEAKVTRIEFEGPHVSIYSLNPGYIMSNSELIKMLAKELKKHIIIKGDEKARAPKEEVEKVIRKMITDGGNEVDKIYFNDQLGDVYIFLRKPQVIKGLDKAILSQTGWRPVIVTTALDMSKGLPRDDIDAVNNVDMLMSKERAEFLKSIGLRIHRLPVYKNEYVKVTCLGACFEVGRSALLIETSESRVLLDAGVKPSGGMDEAPFFDVIDVDNLDAVVISHAHLDHIGMLPYLYKYGYKGPVYMTEPTKYLMEILLTDYIDLSSERGYSYYGLSELASSLYHSVTVDYGDVTDISPDIKLTLYDAGHEIGSALSHLHIGNGLYNIVYTGDFKYGPSRLLNPAHSIFKRVELLIMESTYGGKDDVQKPREEAEAELIQLVGKTLENGGKVLIPVFSTGRAQEILFLLNDSMQAGKLTKAPIYVDGMVLQTLNVHLMFPDYLNNNVKELIYDGVNPFISEYVKPVERARNPDKRQEQVMDILQGPPSIILAPHGMLSGGPAMDYFVHMADDAKNSLIFVSYQGEGTLGRRLIQGERKVNLKYYDQDITVNVNMNVFHEPGFSGHSDRKQLMNYVGRIEPKPHKVMLVHGEPSKLMNLALSIELKYKIDTVMLNHLESIRLV